jgi:menaquinone-9 beta-reductase
VRKLDRRGCSLGGEDLRSRIGATSHDAIVVGGGPAGSTAARFLRRGGARVAVIDRAAFPRVKLCGGWLSRTFWDALEIPPREYPGQLLEWSTCHVRYGGDDRAIACRGWFVRRVELDDFLLRQSGADLHLETSVKDISRDADGVWTVAGLRARHLIGAGGTYCPVARLLAPPRPNDAVGVQEHEFRADRASVGRTRIGADGEPELYLHDDLRGYSWNVAKTDWINVGSGTVDAHEVRAAWARARMHFLAAGHIPAESLPDLEPRAMKGYTYYLYHPAHLDSAARVAPGGDGGVYLVGDSLGLAHPLTAEGILPAVISGRIAAEAILDGTPASYPERLAAHPALRDYHRLFRVVRVAAALRGRRRRRASVRRAGIERRAVVNRAVMNGFAWMFSGARLPGARLIDAALSGAERWLGGAAANGGS